MNVEIKALNDPLRVWTCYRPNYKGQKSLIAYSFIFGPSSVWTWEPWIGHIKHEFRTFGSPFKGEHLQLLPSLSFSHCTLIDFQEPRTKLWFDKLITLNRCTKSAHTWVTLECSSCLLTSFLTVSIHGIWWPVMKIMEGQLKRIRNSRRKRWKYCEPWESPRKGSIKFRFQTTKNEQTLHKQNLNILL